MPAVTHRRHLRLAAALACAAASFSVLACPNGQKQVCMAACFCVPAAQGDMAAIFDSVGQVAATGLREWLVHARHTAATGATQPIPLHIRAQLEPYYDLRVLESVRYKVGDQAELDAANATLQNPNVRAVTLIDIIVFRSAADAQDDVALWAHELHHVQQYQQWGVDEFASRYARDYRAVEAPAYEIQARVAEALKTAPAAP